VGGLRAALREAEELKQIPIFDTNVLADVQRGKISESDWRAPLRHRPRHGWPLSSVTAFELLAAVDAAPPENFPNVKERIALAYNLAKGIQYVDAQF
jgi:predicted nucleic acid-binding protein